MSRANPKATKNRLKCLASAEFPTLSGSQPRRKSTIAALPKSSNREQRSYFNSLLSPKKPSTASMRKQIAALDAQVKKAFAQKKYEDVREIGLRKKSLEAKLKVLHELQAVREEIAKVEKVLKNAFSNQNYQDVAVLGRKKEKLESILRILESNSGLNTSPPKVPNGIRIPSNKSSAASSTTGPLMKGEIKLWFPRKAFGFIRPDNKGEPDIFFHATHVAERKQTPIRRFARVTFTVLPAERGPQAREVSITSYQTDKEKAAEKEAEAKTAAAAAPKTAAKAKEPRRGIKQMLASADNFGSIKEIRDSRSLKKSGKETNQVVHRNWGSISSAMGSMHFDSISSVNDLFARSSDTADRPKMSIQGQGKKRRARDSAIRSSMNPAAQKMLNDILAKKANRAS